MIFMKKYSLIVFFFIYTSLSSQQFNANVVVNYESVNQTNNSIFKNLENSISSFINNNNWSSDNFENFERINLNVLITLISYSDNLFSANFEFQSIRPIYNSSYSTPLFKYIDKNVQFEYQEFEPIIYRNDQFESDLSSLLSFYSNIILGLDRESYVLNSGDTFFNNSENILKLANQNNRSGWNSSTTGGKINKFWLIENLSSSSSSEFKSFIYNYHSNGLDIMYDNIAEAKIAISSSISALRPIQRRNPNSILLKIIFDSKSDEIKDIFSGGTYFDNSKLINDLNYLSPFFSNKWNSLR